MPAIDRPLSDCRLWSGKNDKVCTQNDGHYSRNDVILLNNDGYYARNDEFLLNNDGYYARNDEFLLKNDGFRVDMAALPNGEDGQLLPAIKTVFEVSFINNKRFSNGKSRF